MGFAALYPSYIVRMCWNRYQMRLVPADCHDATGNGRPMPVQRRMDRVSIVGLKGALDSRGELKGGCVPRK